MKKNKILIREQRIKPKGKEQKSLYGAGKKPFNELVDNWLLEWIYDGREKILECSVDSLWRKPRSFIASYS